MTTTGSAPALLCVDDVRITYKRPGQGVLTAVDGVSLELARGEVLGLVGESGCGKSTLARAICGLEPLAGGAIRYEGAQVRPLGLRRRARPELGSQMVSHNPYASHPPRRRIGEQIEDARARGRAPGASVENLLADVDLPAGAAASYPHQFSGGQRQRIAIARALAAGPHLLIGDEPIASLDASLQARLALLMRDLARERGTSLLFISHDLAVVRLIADRIAVMRAGRVVEVGTAQRVWSAPEHPYTAGLLASIPIPDGAGRLPGPESAAG